MNFLAFLRCLVRGHQWRTSRSRPGYLTCVKCRMRKRIKVEPPPADLA